VGGSRDPLDRKKPLPAGAAPSFFPGSHSRASSTLDGVIRKPPNEPATSTRVDVDKDVRYVVKYEVVVLFFDDEGNECGSLVSERSHSPHNAAKDVLHRYDNIRNEVGLLKKPVDHADDLKWAARRFGA
jgi:hypothetical protein